MSRTIFEELREDHQTQRQLIDLLVKTSGDSEGRGELFARLKAQLEAHARYEEKFFYSELMQVEMTIEKARHSVAEHKELDDFLETLEEKDMSSPAWLPEAKKLCDRLLHHLEEEEHEVFQLAGKALSDSQKTSLGGSYREAMSEELSGKEAA